MPGGCADGKTAGSESSQRENMLSQIIRWRSAGRRGNRENSWRFDILERWSFCSCLVVLVNASFAGNQNYGSPSLYHSSPNISVRKPAKRHFETFVRLTLIQWEVQALMASGTNMSPHNNIVEY